MNVRGIRQRKARAVAVAAMVGAGGLGLSGGVGSAAAGAVSSSTTASIVPPAGSATAMGYSAIIRHQTSATDNQGELVLVAPDRRHKVIGEVSDGAEVFDISTNARTVITGFRNEDTGELRLTIWSTETNARAYLRVNGGKDAVLTYNGLVVSRGAAPMQLFSRSGTVLRTFDGTSYGKLTATPEGDAVFGSDYETRQVQWHDVDTGEVKRTIPLPDGDWILGCEPSVVFSEDIYVQCTDDGFVDSAYRVEDFADLNLVKIASQAAKLRPVGASDGDVGYMYDHNHVDDPDDIDAPQLEWMRSDGSTSAVKVNSAPNDRYDLGRCPWQFGLSRSRSREAGARALRAAGA